MENLITYSKTSPISDEKFDRLFEILEYSFRPVSGVVTPCTARNSPVTNSAACAMNPRASPPRS